MVASCKVVRARESAIRPDAQTREMKQVEQGHPDFFSYWGKARPPTDSGPQFHLYDLAGQAVRQWLGDRSRPALTARHGFHALDDLRVDAYRQQRMGRSGDAAISLSTVDLTGTLEVADPVPFTSALLHGVGHGKGFGCGLLLVQRPRHKGIL